MAWRIVWNPAAVVEAETEAVKYTLKREGLGDRFLDEIDAAIERIADAPEHFQRWPDEPSYRRAVVHVFPFVVFYWLDEPRQTGSSCPSLPRSANPVTGSSPHVQPSFVVIDQSPDARAGAATSAEIARVQSSCSVSRPSIAAPWNAPARRTASAPVIG